MNCTNNASYGFKGKKHTEGYKKYMSQINKGRSFSRKTRQKMKDAWEIKRLLKRPLTIYEKRARRYGVTPQQLQEYAEITGGKCAVCLIANWEVVDHDHISGKVRGLLCSKCNMALGLLADDNNRLERALIYLHGDVYV